MKLPKIEARAFIKNVKTILIVFTAIIIVAVPVYLFVKHQQNKAELKNAATAAENGHYDVAAQKMVAAFNSENDPKLKASKAYTTGLYFYYSGNNTEGKKWMNKAVTMFEKLHQPNQADSARAMIARFDSLGKSSPSKPDNNRGKDYAL